MKKANLNIIAQESLKQVAEFIKECEDISRTLYSRADVLTVDNYTTFENKLVGMYTFINTQYKKLSSLKLIEKTDYFNNLKARAAIEHTNFHSMEASKEADSHVSDLETAEALLSGYVESIYQLILTCRQRTYQVRREEHVTKF